MKRLLTYSILILVALGMVYPLFWMLIVSFRENPSQYRSFSEILLAQFTMENYRDALSADRFDLYFVNSLFVAIIVTIGNCIFCLLAGYALARRDFFGKKILFASVLGVMMLPPHVIMIPLYRLIVNLGWMNSYLALIVPWLVQPFGIFLVKQYVESVPTDIEDAARIDGASEWYILLRIVTPLCKPIIAVLAVYIFLGNWNSFLFPFLFVNDEIHRTLPVGLAFYLGKQSLDWGNIMAAASLSALPILAIFAFFQRQIISSLTTGALKE